MTVRVEHGDCLEVIPRLVAEGVVCDAVVTDPPYGLGFMGIAWDTMPAGRGKPVIVRQPETKWDGSVAFRPETWATIATILRPGGFLVAFGGTRTYHRLVCAIEDAGFIVQDQIAWMFGSGFPKRRDMLKPAQECIAIAQKPFGIREQICGLKNSLGQMVTSRSGMAAITALSTVSSWLDTLDALSAVESMSITETASRTTIDWKTLSFCLSKITPESIIQAHSLGHLSNANASPAIRFSDASVQKLKTILAPSVAELATSQVPIERLAEADVGIEPICLAYKPGGKRTMQVDECRIGVREKPTITAPKRTSNVYGAIDNPGGKLLPAGRWPANVAHDGSDEVLAAFPDALGSHDQMASVSDNSWFTAGGKYNGAGNNDKGSAARFFYCAKADKQDRWGSRHPTVKPIDLIRWLVRLVTPPWGLVLDPFAGSGTTAAAVFADGRNAILIEREAEYVADIRERMAWYEGGGVHSTQAKNRNRGDDVGALRDGNRGRPVANIGPLFERPYDESADLAGSYYAAIEEIGRRVKAGEPVPECMLKQKEP